MGFSVTQKVLFKHCDPAGMVFYPRYFEMMNDCVEAFFGGPLGLPFEVLHQTGSVPTAEIATRFLRPSRHGDVLDLTLRITRVGRTSAAYAMVARCGPEERFRTEATLVHVDTTGRPTPWPEAVRARLVAQAAEDREV